MLLMRSNHRPAHRNRPAQVRKFGDMFTFYPLKTAVGQLFSGKQAYGWEKDGPGGRFSGLFVRARLLCGFCRWEPA